MSETNKKTDLILLHNIKRKYLLLADLCQKWIKDQSSKDHSTIDKIRWCRTNLCNAAPEIFCERIHVQTMLKYISEYVDELEKTDSIAFKAFDDRIGKYIAMDWMKSHKLKSFELFFYLI